MYDGMSRTLNILILFHVHSLTTYEDKIKICAVEQNIIPCEKFINVEHE